MKKKTIILPTEVQIRKVHTDWIDYRDGDLQEENHSNGSSYYATGDGEVWGDEFEYAAFHLKVSILIVHGLYEQLNIDGEC